MDSLTLLKQSSLILVLFLLEAMGAQIKMEIWLISHGSNKNLQ